MTAGRGLLLVWAAFTLLACRGREDGPTGPDDGEPEGPDPFGVAVAVPAPGATGASVLAPVTVSFNRTLDTTSLDGGLRVFRDGRALRGAGTFQPPATLRWTAATPLDPGMALEVRAPAGLRAQDGSTLPAPLNWTFRTGGSALETPDSPRIAGTVAALAHDSLKGRGSASVDELRAAEGMARVWAAVGLVPFGGGWVHPFSIPRPDAPQVTAESRNVLGVVPGRGSLAGEWVVVGAHYDHLGTRVLEDGAVAIFNGADDNGSGSAAVAELARLWSRRTADGDATPRRSLLFALWGAEEWGLLGSCHFARSGALPTERIRAVLNFDMVGRLGRGPLKVPGVDSASSWLPVLEDADRTGVGFDGTPVCDRCSDHACFRDAGVPVLWFFTGTHGDYHRPSDDAERLDYPGLATVTGIAQAALWRLAVGR